MPKVINQNLLKSAKLKNQDILFLIMGILSVALLLWKSKYGFGGEDETFYLTIPQRLLSGDSFIVDEWHLSQLSAFLILPFTGMYKLIVGSYEGIIIAERINFLIIHLIISIIIYSRIRKYGLIATFICIYHFLFFNANIMALSYDTLGVDLLALSGVLLGTSDYKNKIYIKLCGFLYAGAVLCCPYLAVILLIYFALMIISQLFNKKLTFLKYNLFSVSVFLQFLIGICILAMIFLIFVFRNTNIEDIINNIPYLFTDPEHPNWLISDRVIFYFLSIFNYDSFLKPFIIVYFLMLVVLFFDKNRYKHSIMYLIISMVVCFSYYIVLYKEVSELGSNRVMFPLVYVGFVAYILCRNKPKELFFCVYLTGIVYTLAVSFSSNQYFYVISMAASVSNIASLIFLSSIIKEVIQDKDISMNIMKNSLVICAIIMIFSQGLLIVKSNLEYCFFDGQTVDKNSLITSGPAKGIYTSEENVLKYDIFKEDISNYKNKESGNILFLTDITWGYLDIDFPYGTYSAWLSGTNKKTLERLKLYYEINPDKTPVYVYIPKDVNLNLEGIYSKAKKLGYMVEENNVSYKLEKIKK